MVLMVLMVVMMMMELLVVFVIVMVAMAVSCSGGAGGGCQRFVPCRIDLNVMTSGEMEAAFISSNKAMASSVFPHFPQTEIMALYVTKLAFWVGGGERQVI
jgi:hypothetical protein